MLAETWEIGPKLTKLDCWPIFTSEMRYAIFHNLRYLTEIISVKNMFDFCELRYLPK